MGRSCAEHFSLCASILQRAAPKLPQPAPLWRPVAPFGLKPSRRRIRLPPIAVKTCRAAPVPPSASGPKALAWRHRFAFTAHRLPGCGGTSRDRVARQPSRRIFARGQGPPRLGVDFAGATLVAKWVLEVSRPDLSNQVGASQIGFAAGVRAGSMEVLFQGPRLGRPFPGEVPAGQASGLPGTIPTVGMLQRESCPQTLPRLEPASHAVKLGRSRNCALTSSSTACARWRELLSSASPGVSSKSSRTCHSAGMFGLTRWCCVARESLRQASSLFG